MRVLILVLGEYGLREDRQALTEFYLYKVLILVLGEYGLRDDDKILISEVKKNVLILVLGEYGLRDAIMSGLESNDDLS